MLVPNGSFGLMWNLLDESIPWEKDLSDFLRFLDERNSLVFPQFENWKEVFSLLSQHLFSTPEECIGFEHCLQARSFDQAYKHFASYAIIAGGSESDKKAFRELFNELMEKRKGCHLRALDLNCTCTGATRKFKTIFFSLCFAG